MPNPRKANSAAKFRAFWRPAGALESSLALSASVPECAAESHSRACCAGVRQSSSSRTTASAHTVPKELMPASRQPLHSSVQGQQVQRLHPTHAKRESSAMLRPLLPRLLLLRQYRLPRTVLLLWTCCPWPVRCPQAASRPLPLTASRQGAGTARRQEQPAQGMLQRDLAQILRPAQRDPPNVPHARRHLRMVLRPLAQEGALLLRAAQRTQRQSMVWARQH